VSRTNELQRLSASQCVTYADPYGPLVRYADAMKVILELEAELKQALRPWPPSGSERNVECVRFVEGTNQWFVCSSTRPMYLADEVLFRELPTKKGGQDG